MKQAAAAALCAVILAACAALPGAAPEAANARFTDPAHIDEAFPPGLAEVFFDSDRDRLNGHVYLANGAGRIRP